MNHPVQPPNDGGPGAGRVQHCGVPTGNERKALWFIAMVALSGSGVRLWRAQGRQVDPSAAIALDHQLERADSARREGVERRMTRGDRPRRERRDGGEGNVPPPRSPSPPGAPTPAAPVDMDRADSAAIEALPGIGPALASRIVAHRDSAGSFGEIDALCDVRGIGPALVKRLRPLVTFTGPRRPLSDVCDGGSERSRKSTAPRRRKPG
jgi:Helix-hairpin-helix motif